MTVVVNGLGPKAKFQGKNLKSKVDFYLFLSFIPIHFFSPCYISITSQSYRQHSLVKPGRTQKDWAGMSRSSIQFSSQMSNFWPVSLAHLTEWLLCILACFGRFLCPAQVLHQSHPFTNRVTPKEIWAIIQMLQLLPAKCPCIFRQNPVASNPDKVYCPWLLP